MVSLQNSAGVTFTFQDGDVESVEVDKTANLDETPLAGSDSEDTFVLDFNGVVKTISISGVITDATSTRTSSGTTTTIAQQVAWIEALVDGNQAGFTASTTFQSSKTVYIRSFRYTEMRGLPSRVEFSLELVEGT